MALLQQAYTLYTDNNQLINALYQKDRKSYYEAKIESSLNYSLYLWDTLA